MSKKSSYQARLRDIAELKAKILELRRDIFYLLGRAGEFNQQDAKWRWSFEFDLEDVIMFGGREEPPLSTKGIFNERKKPWYKRIFKRK